MNAHRTSLLLAAATTIAGLGLTTANAWTGITGSGKALIGEPPARFYLPVPPDP